MPDFSEILEHVDAFADEPDALRDYLWRCKRVFGERFVATLDRDHPWWRGVMGARIALLSAARGGPVAPWIDVAALPFAPEWSDAERERYVRWFSEAYGDSTRAVRPPCPDPPPHGPFVDALLAQWQAAGRPKAGRWVVDAVFRLGEPEARRGLVHEVWSDDALKEVVWGVDRPEAWTLAQQVASMHDSASARRRAQRAIEEWATAHGRSAASFGDHIALYWDVGLGERVFDPGIQRRRLESAMVERLEWSWSELREVVLQDHPIARLLQEVVWWTDEGVA